MTEYAVKIISIDDITHDVKRFRLEKPDGYSFIPGQAASLSINTPEMKDKRRPFTFTGLMSDPFLEFTIKIYDSHKGVTAELAGLIPGKGLMITRPWGSISYKGPGVFIAGGAGITPFMAILRDLRTKDALAGNMLIFANKTRSDIIYHDELRAMLGDALINILSDEKHNDYASGFITEDFLKKNIGNFDRRFYLCGPPPMTAAVKKQLASLGADTNAVTLEF